MNRTFSLFVKYFELQDVKILPCHCQYLDSSRRNMPIRLCDFIGLRLQVWVWLCKVYCWNGWNICQNLAHVETPRQIASACSLYWPNNLCKYEHMVLLAAQNVFRRSVKSLHRRTIIESSGCITSNHITPTNEHDRQDKCLSRLQRHDGLITSRRLKHNGCGDFGVKAGAKTILIGPSVEA